MKNKTTLALVSLAMLGASSLAHAAQHTVKLLTSASNGQMMMMDPGFLKIAPGDSVNFVPADSSHNAMSVSIPQGATAFNTPMGKATVIEFTQKGVYVYKCLPHLPLGMVGIIQVGQASNLAQVNADIVALKPQIAMNKERLDQYMAQVK